MQERKFKVIAVVAFVVLLHVGAFVLLMTKPELYDAIFKKEAQQGYMVSPSRLSQIVEEIRGHSRQKWLEKLSSIDDAAQKMDQLRQQLFVQMRDGARGEAYLNQFLQLSKAHHQDIQQLDLSSDKVSLNTVFEACKDAERRLTNYYRDVLGAKNALRLEIPALDAVSFVKVVPPRRIDLAKQALDHDVRSRTDGTLDAFKHNINIGASEIDAMVKYALKVMERAGIDVEGGTEEGFEQVAQGAFGSTLGETLRPDELFLGSATSDGGFGVLPGRVIARGGSSNANLFIDRWYVIGPFENNFRRNLDASFMPESVVDLETSTIGKDGKEIRWEYWRKEKQRIEPDWAPRGCVYYGWTEIFVERGGKYWVSLGSDDYGKLWINGELVWKSDTTPKPYRADEHTAEFDFKEGVNELLFRCENAGGTMGWSVIFHLKKDE